MAIDPESGLNSTYSWDIAPDLNSDGKMLACGHVPVAKGTGINPMQETMFLGGMGLTKMYQTFRNDLQMDDGANFEAEAVLNNIDPTLESSGVPDTKRFCQIDFPTINPYDTSGVAVQFAVDAVDPHRNPTTWNELDYTTGDTTAGIPSGVARWLNIRLKKTGSADPTRGLLAAFVLYYYRLYHREGRDG